MGNDGNDFICAMGHDSVSRLDEGAAGICHIVDENGDFGANVADEGHFGDFVGASTFFVDESEVEVEAIGYGCCSVPCQCTACIVGGGGDINLFAPPASGLTMTALLTSRFSLIQRKVLGSAYKLSTGTLKKPWI